MYTWAGLLDTMNANTWNDSSQISMPLEPLKANTVAQHSSRELCDNMCLLFPVLSSFPTINAK